MKLDVIKPDDEGGPWYAAGLSFTCTQCGNCCTGPPGYVWISREEIGRLAEYLKLTPQETVERYCRKIGGRFSLNERRTPRNNYDCVFLKEEQSKVRTGDGREVLHTKRTCTIYPVRPLQCRTWPFWDGNLASEKAWRAAGARCPGMDRGEKHSLQQIEALRTAKNWPEGDEKKDVVGSDAGKR